MARRGSSLFAQPGAAAPAPGGGPSKRQSAVLQPMAGGLGLDFDSDYESDEDVGPQPPQQPARPPAVPTGSAGGPNDRPMVGGFAAAAYEAAKAYHYQNKDRMAAKKAGSSGAPKQRSSRPQK